MIQILGLRDYTDASGKVMKRETFFTSKYRAPNLEALFKDPESILTEVPPGERFNLYFTVADCHEERGRKLKEQWAIPFDIDALVGENTEEVIAQAVLAADAACEAIGVRRELTGIIFSGNGVQFFVLMKKPITDNLYFETNREHYKALCSKIQSKLLEKGVSGTVDPSVFSSGRLMRMPETLNKKPGKPTRKAFVIQNDLKPQSFDITVASGIGELQKHDQILPDVIKRYPKPDTKAVLEGCGFIRWNFEKPQDVKEYQWYAAQSIVARLEDGPAKCHQMSEGHPGYSFYETELKIEQALTNAGPRTCKNISTLWDGCKTCPHYGSELVSPILIHGPDYIKSKDHGYREMTMTKEGALKPGRPAFDDLIKQFEQEHPFVNISEQKTTYVFDKTHWKPMYRDELKAWMSEIVVPSVSSAEMKEFVDRISVKYLRNPSWFHSSTEFKMNFQNGILDLKSMELVPHSEIFGFTFVLPYAYDKNALCPKWDKFMDDVMMGNQELVRLLEDFGGYSISGDFCMAGKGLILLGDGSNGKSVYAEVLAAIAGDGNYSSLMLQSFKNEQSRALLVNKLFNYSDETSFDALKDSSFFKAMITGGEIQAKIVYVSSFQFRNRAKLIILANELPRNFDNSHGLYRRLLIVNFNRLFEGASDNKSLKYEMMKEELPGICNRLLAGYKRLVANENKFDVPGVVQTAIDEYREDSDTVLRFFKENIEQGTENIPLSEVFAEYMSWCHAEDEDNESARMFSKRLRKVMQMWTKCEVGKSTTQTTDDKRKKVRVVTNIKLHRGNSEAF